jgi:hexaprenyl-diphosphate synthase
MEYIQNTSAVERTHLLAQAYADKARDVLRLLPDGDSKLGLEALTEVVMNRTW